MEEKPADSDDVLSAVGPRLRALRMERGVTLTDLSTSTGISVSTLSRLESGQRRPTLEQLLPLAQAHHVQLDELVDAPPTGDPRVHAKPIKRHGVTFVPLSRRPGGIQAYKQIMPAGWHAHDVEQQVHDGYEWLYILDGSIRLLLGDNDLMLRTGEVAEFDTRTPHGLSNPTNSPAEILCLYGTQGQRAHVRVQPKRR